MKTQDISKHLLQAWIVSYEKAIVQQINVSKKAIDQASCEAVEVWTKCLYDLDVIQEIKGKDFETIKDSVNHHIDNLIKGGMWDANKRPTVEATDDGDNVFRITISDCTYKDGCKWGLDVPEFREDGKYRCQRMGCFVGAVKKYMNEVNLPPKKKEKLDYLMTTVMDENQGCQGLLFLNENFMKGELTNKYPTQFPNDK